MKGIKILQQKINTGLSSFVRDITKGFRIGIGIVLALTTAGIFAVAVTGTFNTFTSGSVLKAADINANFASLKAAIEGIPTEKAMRLIHETDVTGTVNSVNITGLNGDSDINYEIFIRIAGVNGVTNNTSYYMQINGDSNVNNYGCRMIYYHSGGYPGSAGLINDDTISGLNVAGAGNGAVNGAIFTGRFTLFSKSGLKRTWNGLHGKYFSNSDYMMNNFFCWWQNTASNITSLQLVSTQSNTIGAGSRIEVWARR